MTDPAQPLRLLVLDHFFDQDIDALRRAGGDRVQLDVWPYHPLRWEAMQVFPAAVGTGLETFASDALAPQRAAFAARFRTLLQERYVHRPFDAFVAPSDVFFYVRSAPAACHRLGVPFFVAQKETTIAEHTMREHALHVGRHAPPVADHMTVCSERHKAFWVRAGADPATITVTGQPRFDVYADLAARGASPRDAPTILFFSYQVDAYHPSEGDDAPVWRELHRQTEEGLWALARQGWRVRIKPHPQQGESGGLRETVAGLGADLRDRVELIPGGADTRDLIADADVITGFQTTALLEGMLAGKPVLYTAWDPEAVRLGGELIPFAEWDDAIDVLRAPDALPAVAQQRRGVPVTPAVLARRRELAEAFLGPVDGAASDRTLAVIARVAGEHAARRPAEAEALRARLEASRAPRHPVRTLHRKLDGARELVRDRLRR